MKSASQPRRWSRAFVAMVVVMTAVTCGRSPTSPSWVTDEPFQIIDLQPGDGVEAVAGKTVSVLYFGYLFDASRPDNKGVLFDATPTGTSFNFRLGATPPQVIAGWEQGVPGMKVNGVRRLIIPPHLAYGATGTANIPANATLVFEIGLLAVN